MFTSELFIGAPGSIVKGVWRATQLVKLRVKWDELYPWITCFILLTAKGTKTDRFMCTYLYHKCHSMGFLVCLMSNPIFTNGDRNSLKRSGHSQIQAGDKFCALFWKKCLIHWYHIYIKKSVQWNSHLIFLEQTCHNEQLGRCWLFLQFWSLAITSIYGSWICLLMKLITRLWSLVKHLPSEYTRAQWKQRLLFFF